MMGTLQKIDITEELVLKVAKKQFSSCNAGELQDQNNYVIGMWLNGACDILDDFNTLIEIFSKIHFKCGVNNHGCGWDVEEYYKE